MTSDQADEMRWRRRRVRQETLLSGLTWGGYDAPPSRAISLKWTKSASGLLAGVLNDSIGSGKEHGKSLPYASLRSVIEARVPGTCALRSDLGKPWTDIDPRPFIRVIGGKGDGSDIIRAVSGAVAQWATDVLFSWADRLDIGTEKIDRIRALGLDGRLVEFAESSALSIPPGKVKALENFQDVRDAVLSNLVAALDGQELFDGLGPVHRLISSGLDNREVEFETWPVETKVGSFSMTCTASVETLPWSDQPYVIVHAGKRIWMDRFPRSGELFGRKRITARLMVRGDSRVSVAYDMPLKSGVPAGDGIDDPAFLATVLWNGIDLGKGIQEIAGRMDPGGNAFVAVPYSTKFGRTKVPRGATAQDQVDLFGRVSELTARFGFSPMPFKAVAGIGDHEEYNKSLKTEMLLHHAAIDLRLNDVDDDRLTTLFEEVVGEKPDKSIKSNDVASAGLLIEKVRVANDERLTRVFPERVKVVFLSRTSAEADLFTTATRSMFSTVDVVRYSLPPNVHGIIEQDKDRKRFAERFEARVDAWRPLAETIAKSHPRARIIVQVDKEYGHGGTRKREEDAVNKSAGRYALARLAGANVQYLLPMEKGGATEYLIRLQAALYDLLFGHSGMAPAIGPAVKQTFPESQGRPDSILGFSVIRKSRLRRGGASISLIAATLLDAESGAVSAKISSTSGRSSWMEFGDALAHVASLGATDIGDAREDEKLLYQNFVADVVREIVAQGGSPLVLFDATSAQGLWPWLNNTSLTDLPVFGREQVADKSVWEDLSVVRIRTKSTPRLLRLMHQENTSIDTGEVVRDCHASASTVTVRIVDGDDRGNYVTARKWQRTQKVVRGTSTYRSLPGFRRFEKGADGSTLYKRIVHTPESNDAVIPESIDITVVRTAAGAKADAIAALVASLRSGYAHTAMDTTLPAPLSFRSKFEDYMSRHGVEYDDDGGGDVVAISGESLDENDDGQSDSSDVAPVPAVKIPTFGEMRNQFRAGVFNPAILKDTKDFGFMKHSNLTSTSMGSMSLAGRPSTSLVTEPTTLVSDTQELREPRLRVPDFATPEWFKNRMNVTRRDMRGFHDQQSNILKDISGYPWPEERPSLEEFYDFLPEAARYPLFFRCFFQAMKAVRNEQMIKRVAQQYRAEVTRLKDIPEVARCEPGADELIEMIMAGSPHDLAMSVVILDWSQYVPSRSSCERMAALVPELSDYLHDLMECDPNGHNTRLAEVKREMKEKAEAEASELLSAAIATLEANSKETPTEPAAETIDDVANQWESDLLDLIDTAKNALSVGPNAATQYEIAVIADHLKKHLDDFDRLLPKGVSSEPVISRLRQIAEALLDVSQGYIVVADKMTGIDEIAGRVPPLATEQSLIDADALAAAAEADLGRAQTARRAADDLQQRKLPMIEFMPLAQEAMKTLKAIVEIGFENIAKAMDSVEAPRPGTPGNSDRQTVSAPTIHSTPALPKSDSDIPKDHVPVNERSVAPILGSSDAEPEDTVQAEPAVDLDEDDITVFEEDEKAVIIRDNYSPVEESTETEETDHLLDDIEKKSDELFVKGEFGLGYHLMNAAHTVLGDTVALSYSAEEMRLYALGSRIPGLARVSPDGHHQSIEACAAIATHLGSEVRADARRIAMMASVLPTALLQVSEAGNAFNIIDAITTNERCSSFFYLVDLVKKNRSLGFPVTVASLRAASNANADKSIVDDRRKAVLDQINLIKHAQFRFVLGQKVLRSITSKNGIVSEIERAIHRNDIAAVRELANKYADRNGATSLLDHEVKSIKALHAIDGAARERMVAYITDLASGCAAYADAVDQADDIKGDDKQLDHVRELADNFKTGIRNFEAATSEPTGNELLDAAYAHARDVLQNLGSVIRGEQVAEIDRKIVNLELHSPLLWLPGMAWSGAWTPSPKDAVRLISAICALKVPRIQGNIAEAAEAAIEARRDEDAFVPAKMLLTFASHFNIDPGREEFLRATIETNEIIRQAQVKARHADVSKLIAKVRRMALGGLEESTRLNDDLDEIQVDVSSGDIPDFMPEEIDGFRVLDVNAAMSRLDDVERTARRLLDDAKTSFVTEIDRLNEASRITDEEKTRLLKLLDNDELATVTDWIQTFNSGERLPTLTGKVMNEPLDAFNHVLKDVSQIDLNEAMRCIETGVSYGSFDFSLLDEPQRQEAAKALGDWIEFKRKMKNPRVQLSQISAHIPVLLSSIAYSTEFVDENVERSNGGRQIFVVDAEMNLPSAPTSLMLPEFGSLTKGSWRVATVGAATTSAEIMALSDGAEPRGALVLMFGPMSADRRKQLKRDCVKNRRKVLVIDETLLLHYLATPDAAPLLMFEIAQAFTTATPYQDYARSPVPNEMFKGRAREKAKLQESYGSYIVYGGRRLGKTALLRHISRNAPEHSLFKFLDLNNFPLDSFWQHSSEALGEVFAKSVNTPEAFVSGVMDYLKADNRRRILLMLDEADNFIKHQASEGYSDVVKLLNLMAETDHRFKFVLAGLHNVSRIIKSENSPLAQISNDPIRIGPLLQEDVGDAEVLVRGPMSALGFEFENREDVWRILSFTNYYPVLIQVFCKGLIDILDDKIRLGLDVRAINGSMVDDAMRNPQIRKLLYDAFDKTITGIEQRYALLTYIIAYDAYFSSGQGLEADGLSASEVTESATRYWPQAFPKGSDPSEIDYLLDEMEGFGILRRTASKKWTLRSRMLLDLLVSSEEDLTDRLGSFDGKTIEQQFDPKNARRTIEISSKGRHSATKTSPLTDGQMSQIFAPPADDTKVMVIFGTRASGIGDVVAAIDASGTYAGGEPRSSALDIRGWGDRDQFVSDLRRNPIGKKRIVVVPPQTTWKPDWVTAVSRLPSVIRQDVRPVFVGGPNHVEAWVEAFRKSPSLSRIKVEVLRPWARSFLATRLDAMHMIGSIEDVLHATEGWSEPTQAVLVNIQKSMKVNTAIDHALSVSVKDGAEAIGIKDSLAPSFVTLAQWCNDTGVKVDYGKDAIIGESNREDIDPDAIIRFGTMIGVLSLTNASAPADEQKIFMDAFVRRVLLAGDVK